LSAPSRSPIRVAIALGSNLGDRAAYLSQAVQALRASGALYNLGVSSFIETEPVGVVGQPPYLNGALIAETWLEPRPLLELLLEIERNLGRLRPFDRAPRTLDLDLILYGDRRLNEPDLQVPHPRFRERRFVLEPLAELAPDWVDPVTNRTIAELLLDLVARTDR
jgi:2-amino-4-hydroxy-6-hydroxymethyldihydropteridine diphosphokinase